ncbi:MAG: single-stranded-DNA-specific exonuclease RecJ [Patescibacteria group bacterium]
MQNKWQPAKVVPSDFINKFPEVNPIIAQLLYNRGLDTDEKIQQFLNPDFIAGQHDPFLFRDMEKAVQRLLQAVEKKEKILVHGDYDADGVCSSAIIMNTLKELGAVNTDTYIPHRQTEGYGINMEASKKFADNKVDLIITVDCGISNAEEIEYLASQGIDVIVTDHHYQPLTLPEKAFAIIDPALKDEQYPEKEISGTAVAFKFAQAIIRKKDLGEAFEKWLLDLVAISIVTDCIPIKSETRTLLKYGLIVLNKTQRLGIRALIDAVRREPGEKITTQFIAFRIGPRINAAGRLNHANVAYNLLMTEDPEEAREKVEELNQTNVDRQKICEKIRKEVAAQIDLQRDNQSLYGFGAEWPLGVVGIVAGKIADEENKPTIIFTENEGELTGSGRSIEQFNLIKALQECEELFSRFGGHSQAAGFTLAKGVSVDQFKECFEKKVAAKLKDEDLRKTVPIEAEIKLEDINWELYEQLEKFEPYGEANWRPNFLSKNVKVYEMQTVGKQNNHLKLVLESETGKRMKFIAFGFGHLEEKLSMDTRLDVVFDLDVNEWNGNRELQCKLIDVNILDE